MRTDRLQQEYGVELRWSVFPLHPETPEEGAELSELFRGREREIGEMQERLRRLARELGLAMAERSRTYNSRRAQELGKWAESRGQGAQFRRAVYRAYFAEGRNIALVDELALIAEEAGLAGNEARAVLSEGSFAAAVDGDWQRARELGVTAVPSHRCGGKWLVGFAPYEDFVRLIERGGGAHATGDAGDNSHE